MKLVKKMPAFRFLVPFLSLIINFIPVRAETSDLNRAYFGMNLAGTRTSTDTSIPFNDIAKVGTPWAYSSNPADPKAPLDNLGNWIPESGKIPFSILIDPDAHGPAGKYLIKWQGTGTVAMYNKLTADYQIQDLQSNSFYLNAPASPTIRLKITKSDPNDPVRQVQCLVPGSENETSHIRRANFDQYHPLFSVVRFMVWQHTNYSIQEFWENRPIPEQQTFNLGTRSGVPLEWMIEFCNLYHISPWFSMPHKADDNYIRQFATLVKQTLNPDLKVYVEYSNEIWNTAPGFTQTAYSNTMADTLPAPLPITKSSEKYIAWYAYRSKQIWGIWDEVYGGRASASQKIVRVAAGWTKNQRVSEEKLMAYDLYKSSDVFAIAPYVGLDQKATFDPTKYTATQLLETINTKIQTEIDTSLYGNSNLAAKYHLPIIAYESGINLDLPPNTTDKDATIKLIIATTRLSQMESVMAAYIRKWFQYSDGLLNLFTDYQNPSQFGTYNNLGEYPGEPEAEAPKLRAVLGELNSPNLGLLGVSGVELPNADPDGDGISNFLEYAYGSDRNVKNLSAAPVIGTQQVSGVDYLSFSYRKNLLARDLTYVAEVSNDLKSWTTDVTTVSETDNGDGTNTVLVRDKQKISSFNKRFIRLRIDTIPTQ